MEEIREYSQQQLEDQALASFYSFRKGENKNRTYVKWNLVVDSVGCKTYLRIVHGDEFGGDRMNLDFEL